MRFTITRQVYKATTIAFLIVITSIYNILISSSCYAQTTQGSSSNSRSFMDTNNNSTRKPPIASLDKAILLNNEAVMEIRNKNYNKAIEKCFASLALVPNYKVALSNLATAYNNLGMNNPPEKAIEYFHKALFIAPDHYAAKENLSFVKGKLNIPATSADDFIKLAQEYERKNDLPSAVSEYRLALILRPDTSLETKVKDLANKASEQLFDKNKLVK